MSELKSVRNYLEANHHIIESLELDFVNWSRVTKLWNVQDNFPSEIKVKTLSAGRVLPIEMEDTYKSFEGILMMRKITVGNISEHF